MPRNRRPRGRNIHGILLLDKPSGLTSNAALQAVKSLSAARKAGHTGSLDPLASGLLPLCFGEATKISGFLLDADKAYRMTCRLGQQTDTADADGQVIAEAEPPTTDPAAWEAALSAMLGPQEQVPPMYSAVRHQGKRLYELAREGQEVERKPRAITIHEFRLLRLFQEGDAHFAELEVRCSKGTYVRTLAEDLAARLGSLAHVTVLRRSGVGPYTVDDAVTLPALEQLMEQAEDQQAGFDAFHQLILPAESAMRQWPALELTAELASYLRQGHPVLIPRAPAEGLVRLHDDRQRFMGVGEVLEDGRIGPKRLIRCA